MTEYNIDALLKRGKEQFGTRKYIYEKHQGKFVAKKYADFVFDVYAFASLLMEKGLSDCNIGLYGPNSYLYMVADIAVMGYVGTCVAISKEWKYYDLENTVTKLKLSAILYDSSKEEEIRPLKAVFPTVLFICLNEIKHLKEQRQSPAPRNPQECSKIVFSSGTTGIPKAIMLSQQNMFANWENLYKRAPLNCEDTCYLFLPLHHVYAGISVFLYSLITGMQIYLCSDTQNIFQEIQQIRPTVFCAVPLIYEKAYRICKSENIRPSDLFGGRMKFLFSGGAFFKPEIRKFLKDDGINQLHSYGLSETSSIICVEYSNQNDFESVGTIFENLDVKIKHPDENGIGEITVRGENVFLGYYRKNLQDTFDKDGYFHTGDIGYIQNNKIYLCGRKKRMILMSNGENVYPDEIEELLMEHESINKAKVFEKDHKIVAQLYVNQQINCETVIQTINQKLPKYSIITDFEMISDNVDVRLK
ncbi:MAG: long-chain fatty acid--CoA ligase [Ruminococcaceae bacterium]|nr:long-chain fatty acid--CoA ligase [Oscillospiraceae bacterium]